MESIDKMTLELLMNRTNYNKYVEKTDPKKFEDYKIYKQKIRKYKSRILALTQQYLDNPDLQISLETNDSFADYAKTIIKHFEMDDLEKSCSYGEKEKEKDEDILFDPTQMTSFEESDNEDNKPADHYHEEEDNKETDEETIYAFEKTGKSFWSKDRVVKKSSNSRFTMDMYVKRNGNGNGIGNKK